MAAKKGGGGGLIGLILALVLAAGAVLFGSAYVAAAGALDALQTADEAKITQVVDFEALKTDLQGEIQKALDAHYKDKAIGPEEKAMADMIVKPFLEAAVLQVASPQALAGLLSASKREGAKVESFQNLLGYAALNGAITGPNGFTLTLANPEKPDDQPAKLQFGRKGLTDWKVVGIDLPPGAFAP